MNSDFIIKDGVLEKYIGSEENVILPDGVEEIGEAVFSGSRVKSVTVNGGLRRIGYRAFHDCRTLESFTAYGKVADIEPLAFYCCDRLTEFNVTESPEGIGAKAFKLCSRFRPELTKLPEHPKYIGDKAFSGTGTEFFRLKGNSGKRSLTHEIITIWGDNTFSCCHKLREVTIGHTVECVSAGMFEGCEALTSVTFLGQTNILPRAFKSCHSLREIEIKSGTITHREAFANCTGLKNIRFTGNGRSTFGKRVFYGCTSLTELVLPKGLRYVPEGAFACCLDLKSVVIPDSVDYAIQRNAFRCCTSLETVKLGKNVEFIDEKAFFGCRNLTSINIPASVKRIGDYAFAECDKLSLSVDPKILAPGSDIFGSTYGLDSKDEITDEEADRIIANTTA